MRPRIAWSAVLLPAPLGPMIPRTRPSSTRRSTPSSATVAPKVLRRPRASMHAMASAFFLGAVRRRRAGGARLQQLSRSQTEPPNGRVNPRPLFREKLLAFAPKQQVARAGIDEHAATSLRLDEFLVGQLLIALEHRDRIDPVLGGNRAHGRQRIAFVQDAVQDHGDDTIAELSVDRLTV